MNPNESTPIEAGNDGEETQSAFIARGLASLAHAERSNLFYAAKDVHAELARRLGLNA
jgi:hypothetical protein